MGNQSMKQGLLSNLKGDFFGGVTAAVVALPLALAFGVASGIGPIAGLYGAIALGFFASIFGGTPSQVSGPTGPMTVAMAAIVIQYADRPSTAFAIVILAGIIQIVLGIAKVGKYVSYTPYSVVSGFMSGIGVIIILIQTLPFFGLSTATGGPLGAVMAWPKIFTGFNFDALMVATISLAIAVFWPKKLANYMPPPLASLLFGTAAAHFIFTTAPLIGNVPTGFPAITVPQLGVGDIPAIVAPAVILALLGAIDSLLTSLVADSITRTRHKSNRELIGQGIGNVAAGIVGGLPGAGATMRTVVNVRAGGRTQLSGALHSIILLALVLGLGPLAEQVPHAALAGILMKVGWDIIDWNYLKRCTRAPRDKVVVMLITFAMTVFVDLITAVAVGLILASFVTARRAEKFELDGVTSLALEGEENDLTQDQKNALAGLDGDVSFIRLRGRFSYASARELGRFAPKSDTIATVFDFSGTAHVDTSAALAVGDLLTDVREQCERVYLVGLDGETRNTLEALGALEGIASESLKRSIDDVIAALSKTKTAPSSD